MNQSAKLARNYPGVRLHTHLAENQDDIKFMAKKYGKRPGEWTESVGWLADDVWHVTEKYDAIRSKLETLDPEIGECHKLDNKQIGRVCNTPMKVRDDCRVFRGAFGYFHAQIFFFFLGSFGVHSSRVRWAHKYSHFDASCNEELYPETETMERLPATGCL